MSSHHIVRENQEPALVIEDFDKLNSESTGQLLEWSPSLITGLPSYFQARDLGIKVDYIILTSGEKSYAAEILDRLPEGTEIYMAHGSFFEGVRRLLRDLHNPYVNIIARAPDPSFFLGWLDEVKPVILGENIRYSYVTSGYSKWKPKGSLIKLIHISDDMEIEGLAPTAEGHFVCTNDGIIRLRFRQHPYLIIGEFIDD